MKNIKLGMLITSFFVFLMVPSYAKAYGDCFPGYTHKWGSEETRRLYGEERDRTVHEVSKHCVYCYDSQIRYEAHVFVWAWDSILEEMSSTCSKCGYVDFNGTIVDCSSVYRNSKSVKVWLYGQVRKGDVITIKIGKKSYKKIISADAYDPVYKVTIKKPRKAKQKITVKLYHIGKKCSVFKYYVCTSKNPKKGMTKNQVRKYTSWGDPWFTKKGSDGHTYWYYSDGSEIVFRKGRVKSWIQ